MKKILVFLLIPFLTSCGSDKAEQENNSVPVEHSSSDLKERKQLNISVLLDLSDRINPAKSPAKPDHYERDIAIIKQLASFIKSDMDNKGAFQSKGKIKIFFSPNPEDSQINSYAQKLDIDLSKMDNKQKKDVYMNIEKSFEENSKNIYQLAIKQGKDEGADVWRFFKNDVKDYCISKDPNYRNILVILTDGYLYHADSKNRVGNKTSYITPVFFQQAGFRNNVNWEQKFKQEKYGLIADNKNLQDLEVLVLEVSPSQVYKNDEDIIRKYLENWFTEMQVKRYAVYNSDLPENTRKRLVDFLAVQ